MCAGFHPILKSKQRILPPALPDLPRTAEDGVLADEAALGLLDHHPAELERRLSASGPGPRGVPRGPPAQEHAARGGAEHQDAAPERGRQPTRRARGNPPTHFLFLFCWLLS